MQETSAFFLEKLVAGIVYFNIPGNFAVPQALDGYTFQKNGAPPHY